MSVPVLDAEATARLLPMDAAIEALRAGFAERPLPNTPQRVRLETRAGELLVMPSSGDGGTGVKLVTLTGSNPDRGLPFVQATYVLFDAQTQSPIAVIDGGALTAVRTAAVSGLATSYLALGGASRLTIFGAGVQAHSHLEAMRTVRTLEQVWVVSRTRDRAEALVAAARLVGIEATVGEPDDVAASDLVCTCTTSPTPLFDGALLRPGTHVNAIGAYAPSMRELDTEAVRRGKVVVETRAAALEEAGDLLIPLREGAIDEDHIVAELGDVVRGAEVRASREDVTVFKSVGIAFEDLFVARALVDRR